VTTKTVAVPYRQEWTRPDHLRGDGPWTSEPDKVVWIDEATGLDLMIHRNPMGAWCGYVGVPPGHPWHGRGYSDVDVTVHGGLTYAAACQEGDDPAEGICHIPQPGRPADVWWLGFDCAHGGLDLLPGLFEHTGYSDLGGHYRDVAYVTGQCQALALQAHAAGGGPS
jgi:hypothetical protein